MKIIEIENVTHRFSDGTIGIDNVSLSIAQGAFVLVAGSNGSGKTTLLRHLNGLLTAQTGNVRIAGLAVKENMRKARQMVGLVFQDADSQIVGETVFDDTAFGPENLGLDSEAVQRRVETCLKVVGLQHLADKRPHVLSGGEKRRLALAGVLAMKPKIVALDEPFSNLDYPGVKQVLNQILDLHARGHTILLTTHDLEKVVAHADRLIIMHKGRVVQDGLPQALIPQLEAFDIRQPCSFRMGHGIQSWLS